MNIKNQITSMLAIASITMAMTACTTNDDLLAGHRDDSGAGSSITLSAEISGNKTSFISGDKIGVATSYTDANTLNREFVYDGTAFTATTGIPFYVKGNCNIVGYYPFTGEDSAEPTLTVSTSNQKDIQDIYLAELTGATRDTKNVHLTFQPLLSKATLTVTVPQGEEMRSWRLSGLKQSASITPNTLALNLAAEAQDLTGILGSQQTAEKDITFTVRLIPQTADATLILIGKKRSYTISLGKITLTNGEHVNIHVNAADGTKYIEIVQDDAKWEEVK